MTLKALLCEPETDFDIQYDDWNDPEAGFAIAESEDGGRIVTCLCRLIQFDEPGCYEFAFSVIVTSPDGTYEDFETQDPRMARGFIPEDARPHVLPTVLNALRALIDATGPAKIYRVTKGKKMPDRAYAKHELITEALQDMNFVITDSGTDPLGRRFWSMTRD